MNLNLSRSALSQPFSLLTRGCNSDLSGMAAVGGICCVFFVPVSGSATIFSLVLILILR